MAAINVLSSFKTTFRYVSSYILYTVLKNCNILNNFKSAFKWTKVPTLTDQNDVERQIIVSYQTSSDEMYEKSLQNDFWSNIGLSKIKYYPISCLPLINSELQIHSFQLHFAKKLRKDLSSNDVTSAWKGV